MIDILETPRGKLLLSDLEFLERQLSSELPEVYRKFLLETNGGDCYKSFVLEEENEVFIADFFGLIDSDTQDYNLVDIRGVYETYRKSKWIPKNAIFIADDGGSSKVLMSLEKETYGQIFYWDKLKLSTNFVGVSISDFPNISWLSSCFQSLVGNPSLEEN